MKIALAYLAALYVLWVYYLAVMNLKRAIDAGMAPAPMKWLGYLVVLPPAVLLDWLVNLALSLPMLDAPAWWQTFAINFALILDAADPSGKHI